MYFSDISFSLYYTLLHVSGYLQKPVEHLCWSIFAKIVNGFELLTIFANKSPSQISAWVENMIQTFENN